MQIKADFTKEELMNSGDPLFEACHPLEKLKGIGALLHAYPHGPNEIESEVLTTVANIIEDARNEIEYLIDISNEQWRRELGEYPKLKNRVKSLERLMNDMANQMEEDLGEVNFKATAANIRNVLSR